MQIRSIRLKNIKSYGEGPEGRGITVAFEPGVNRVAGGNGHGKTTLIEALGYALFFCEPDHDEKFELKTYFLRAGEKEGEIEVVFQHAGHCYRVERALGQSKRRSKIVQVDDGTTWAEGDEAVASCLCRILHEEQRPFNQQQLSDIFANLIGVKQGRLTWPFDSKPGAAKEFFEPVLDVAIFRQSEARLKEARARFDGLATDQDFKLAALAQKVNDRADSREKVARKEAEADAWRKSIEKSRRRKLETEKAKSECEARQAAAQAAKAALEDVTSRLKLAIQKREHDERKRGECLAAREITQNALQGYRQYLKTEEQLRALQQKQADRARLQQQHAQAVNLRTEWQSKGNSAEKDAVELAEQAERQGKQLEAQRNQTQAATQNLEALKADCKQLQEKARRTKQDHSELNAWIEMSGQATTAGEGITRFQSCGWEVKPVLEALAEEKKASDTARKWEGKVHKSEQARQSLIAQLAQISGGICPFLKEKCRQFDSQAVQSDLSHLEKELAAATAQCRQAREAQAQAGLALTRARLALLQNANATLDQARAQLENRERLLVRAERDLENEKRNLGLAERGFRELGERREKKLEEARQAAERVKTAATRVDQLEIELKHFVRLDQEIAELQQAKDRHARDYQSYLQNQQLAERLEESQRAALSAQGLERDLQEQVRQKSAQLELAAQEYKPEHLRQAQDAAAEARGKLALDERELENVLRELRQEKQRFEEWKNACAEQDRIEQEAGRLRAASQLSRLGAKVLKDVAPAVAQHLCDKIARSAQALFNQINQEAIELQWHAEPQYGLKIFPGNRRFAMLSGGEQTKLALAMTLAMIQEFSGLRFAVFDEPTYAVDSESRAKLADAILAAQKAAAMDQLIVVSHDDAFEGKIGNVVLLKKSAKTGTEIVSVG